MSKRFVLLLLGLLAPSIALAQSTPMPPSADPHMTGYDQSGSFIVSYYGPQPDGRLCPPSVNGLSVSISDGRKITGLHSLGVSNETDPSLAALFESGTCRIAFDGEASIRTHHGTNASIVATAAQAADEAPAATGRFTVQYLPVMCLVAPCSPGSYAILDGDGQLMGQVDAILIDDVEAASKSVVRGRYLDWTSGEGTVWFDKGTQAEMLQFEAGERRARIYLTHMVQESPQ